VVSVSAGVGNGAICGCRWAPRAALVPISGTSVFLSALGVVAVAPSWRELV
jgi:hypothetical protein